MNTFNPESGFGQPPGAEFVAPKTGERQEAINAPVDFPEKAESNYDVEDAFKDLTVREQKLAVDLMEMLDAFDDENASLEMSPPTPENLEMGDQIFELKVQIGSLQNKLDLLNRIQVKGEKMPQQELFDFLDDLNIDRSELGSDLIANNPAQQRLIQNYYVPAIRNALAKERRMLMNRLEELRTNPLKETVVAALDQEDLSTQQEVEDRFGFMEMEGRHPKFDINTQKAMNLLKSEGWLEKHQNTNGLPAWYVNLARSSDLPLKYRFIKMGSRDNVLLFADEHLYDSGQDIDAAMIGIPVEIAAKVIPKNQIEQWVK